MPQYIIPPTRDDLWIEYSEPDHCVLLYDMGNYTDGAVKTFVLSQLEQFGYSPFEDYKFSRLHTGAYSCFSVKFDNAGGFIATKLLWGEQYGY